MVVVFMMMKWDHLVLLSEAYMMMTVQGLAKVFFYISAFKFKRIFNNAETVRSQDQYRH